MKFKQVFKSFLLTFIGCSLLLSATACNNEKSGGDDEHYAKGTVEGVVTDALSNPIADVTISVMKTSLGRELEQTVTSDSKGAFSIKDVPMTTRFISFEKDGYASVGITIQARSFVDSKAVLSPVMEYANAVITGKVLDAQNGNKPLSGATVSIGTGSSITTGDDGVYEFTKLVLKDYTLTIGKLGYGSVTKEISADMFNSNGICTIPDIALGGKEILPGLTKQDLEEADCWYTNDYRGGKGNGGGLVDWSCVFMSTLKYMGGFENQNEGCTIRIINDEADQKKPADLDNFNSFTYGKKLITADNCQLTLYVRTHNTTADDPFQFGVQVVDLSADEPVAEKVGENRSHGSDSYSEYVFDLSKYIGKEVIVAVGVYRAKTGDYWHQLPIRHMSFAKEQVNNDNYLPGEEIAELEGWHLTSEMVRSIMPNEKTSFSGLPMGADGHDGLGYNVWNGTNHLAANWGFMYVNKDTEPGAGEGFVIKTPSGESANYAKPCAYFYSKFNITSANDKMTLYARTFDSERYTTFKVTAITEDGTVAYLSPVSNTANDASEVEDGDGCWQFIHNQGEGNAKDYASFVYDLSSFTGKNVVITLGVHKGVTPGQDGEQKLSIYGIDFE